MANITISVPEKLKVKMKEFPEINWSKMAGILLAQKIKRLELLRELDTLLADSTLTDKDCERLSKKLKKEIAKNYKEST